MQLTVRTGVEHHQVMLELLGAEMLKQQEELPLAAAESDLADQMDDPDHRAIVTKWSTLFN